MNYDILKQDINKLLNISLTIPFNKSNYDDLKKKINDEFLKKPSIKDNFDQLKNSYITYTLLGETYTGFVNDYKDGLLSVNHINDINFEFIPAIDYEIKDLGKANYPIIEEVKLQDHIGTIIAHPEFNIGSIIKLTISEEIIYLGKKYYKEELIIDIIGHDADNYYIYENSLPRNIVNMCNPTIIGTITNVPHIKDHRDHLLSNNHEYYINIIKHSPSDYYHAIYYAQEYNYTELSKYILNIHMIYLPFFNLIKNSEYDIIDYNFHTDDIYQFNLKFIPYIVERDIDPKDYFDLKNIYDRYDKKRDSAIILEIQDTIYTFCNDFNRIEQDSIYFTNFDGKDKDDGEDEDDILEKNQIVNNNGALYNILYIEIDQQNKDFTVNDFSDFHYTNLQYLLIEKINIYLIKNKLTIKTLNRDHLDIQDIINPTVIEYYNKFKNDIISTAISESVSESSSIPSTPSSSPPSPPAEEIEVGSDVVAIDFKGGDEDKKNPGKRFNKLVYGKLTDFTPPNYTIQLPDKSFSTTVVAKKLFNSDDTVTVNEKKGKVKRVFKLGPRFDTIVKEYQIEYDDGTKEWVAEANIKKYNPSIEYQVGDYVVKKMSVQEKDRTTKAPLTNPDGTGKMIDVFIVGEIRTVNAGDTFDIHWLSFPKETDVENNFSKDNIIKKCKYKIGEVKNYTIKGSEAVHNNKIVGIIASDFKGTISISYIFEDKLNPRGKSLPIPESIIDKQNRAGGSINNFLSEYFNLLE
jgi:hypothetical protein